LPHYSVLSAGYGETLSLIFSPSLEQRILSGVSGHTPADPASLDATNFPYYRLRGIPALRETNELPKEEQTYYKLLQPSWHQGASGPGVNIRYCNDWTRAVTIPVLRASPGATIADQKRPLVLLPGSLPASDSALRRDLKSCKI
jgi:hypothetical protein